MNEISWLPWTRANGGDYQYNESRRWAGDGILLNKIGESEMFWLAERPNEATFSVLDTFKKNPWAAAAIILLLLTGVSWAVFCFSLACGA